MSSFELILVLLAASTALVLLAQRVGLPYPFVLVFGGLLLAVVPGIPHVEFPPHLVLVVFLPPLLFAAAWFTSWIDFRANLRPIVLLAIGLVVATTVGVAVVAHAVMPGLSWGVAFVLGAIISPPDAVAATAIMKRVRVPRRVVTILEGESLVNDATGLVAYQVALASVMEGRFSLGGAVLRFAWIVAGGIAIGLIVGWAVSKIHRHLEDFLIETVITLLTPYVAYIPADHLGVSGVLAVVVAGGYLGWRNPMLLSPLTRLRSRAAWSVILFLLNSLVFILIGLELARSADVLRMVPLGPLIGWCLAVSAAAIVVRALWVPLAAWCPRTIIPRIRRRERPPDRNVVLLISWTSMRGIVSLTLALALPLALPDGTPFPHRSVLIVIVFAVIFVTLIGQGVPLPAIIRRMRFVEETDELKEERAALVRSTERAIERLEQIEGETILTPWLVERVRSIYAQRLERLRASEREDPECKLTEGETGAFVRLRQQLIEAERGELVALRNAGELTEDTLHKLQQDLDIEAIQPAR